MRDDGDKDVEIGKLLVWLATAFPTGRLTDAEVRTYVDVLRDLDMDQIRLAVQRARKEGGQYFPSAPVLRSMVVATADDAALLAWAALQRAAGDVGAYRDLVVDDPWTADAVARVFGGWPQFCALEDGPAMTLKRHEFVAAYRDARRRVRAHGRPVRLSGLCSQTGRFLGGPGVSVGYLTAGGAVRVGPDRPALPAAKVD